MYDYERLKNFDPRGGVQLEDAIVLAASARLIDSEYGLLCVEKPDWFVEKVEEVRRFVADTQRAARKKMLAELKARRTQYLSATEKRDLLDKQIADHEALSA